MKAVQHQDLLPVGELDQPQVILPGIEARRLCIGAEDLAAGDQGRYGCLGFIAVGQVADREGGLGERVKDCQGVQVPDLALIGLVRSHRGGLRRKGWTGRSLTRGVGGGSGWWR